MLLLAALLAGLVPMTRLLEDFPRASFTVRNDTVWDLTLVVRSGPDSVMPIMTIGDPARERRRLRRAQLLVFLAPIHVLFPITALGMVRDLGRLAEKPDANAAARRRLRVSGAVGLIVSAATFVALSKVAST